MNKGKTARVEIEQLDEIKNVLKQVIADSKKLPGVEYADIRVRVDDGPAVEIENGAVRGAHRDSDCCYGIRVFARDGAAGLGYFGGRLGAEEFSKGTVSNTLMSSVFEAYERARMNGKLKKERMEKYGGFGDSLIDTALAPAETHIDIVHADYSEDPRNVDLEALCERGIKATEAMLKADEGRMKKAIIVIQGLMNRELFASTEGSFIDEAYAKTEAFVVAIAQSGKNTPETHYDILGNMHGLEVLDGRNMFCQTLENFSLGLADDTSGLSSAPLLKGRFEDVMVVTDGHFNCLWVHENVGHPSEADRCLGMETGYAGRSWFFRSLEDNKLGQQIASPLLSVYSTNDLDAYGKFKYDSEGVLGTKVYHIQEGIFKGFLHSRWSAYVMDKMGVEGQVPDGTMRASNALNVPYIRMKQTGIEGGRWDPAEILSDVKDGWYLSGSNIPSMSESRENFTISARKTYRVKNGRLVKLYRGGALTADSGPYMKDIWAVGRDVGLYNIFNCGKAQPMQAMYLCNQAPTMGARGTVIGGRGSK